MPDTGSKFQAAHGNRKKVKSKPGADAGRKVRKRLLRWLKVKPEETPAQIAEREAIEAAEDREDFLADFWNQLPASERLRLCGKGGVIYNAIHPIIEPMPGEIIATKRSKSTLGL